MTWHTNVAMLRGYQSGALSAARAASVETHLAACADCQASLATVVDPARIERTWSAIADRLDGSTTPAEAILVRLGISEPRARLVAMTPSLRTPSLLALVALLALVTLTNAVDGGNPNAFYAFLVLAPLLPLVGVAAMFHSAADPARELTAATPTPAFELLLIRTLAIVAATTVLTSVAAVPLPFGWQAGAWLLPALGLTALTLALSTWMPTHWAGVGLGLAWLTAGVASWQFNRLDADVLARFAALRPGGQLLFAALAVAGAVLLLVRREALDLRRIA
jgi:hypothetical protein